MTGSIHNQRLEAESEPQSLQEAMKFFANTEHALEHDLGSFSLEKSKEFLRQALIAIQKSQFASEDDVSILVIDASRFVVKAREIVAGDLFLRLSHKFKSFCENAPSAILNEYKSWLEIIKKHDKGELQRINLLKIFGVSKKEDPHSKFLVWLMREEESHGLGNAFIELFVEAVTAKYDHFGDVSTEGVAIIPEASGERGTPDIKILGKDYMCIVENKIMSLEGKDQTERYAKDAEETAEELGIPKDRVFLIFLTPTGRKASDKRFKSIKYAEIIKLLRQILAYQTNINTSTRFLIEQFIFNLEMEVLRLYDLDKRIGACLKQYSKHGDKYLWDNYEDLLDIYGALLAREDK